MHTFIGAPNGKSKAAAHMTIESGPISVLLLFFAETIAMLVVEMNRYYRLFLHKSYDGPFPLTWDDRSRNACVLGSDITDVTYSS